MNSHDLLAERTIIVTGAATGIGQAFAIGAAAQGANVVVADMKAADETLATIETAGGRALAVRVDVADDASCQAMARDALDRFGRIDGLVNTYATFVPRERNLSRHEIKASLDGLEQTGPAATLRLAVWFMLLTGVRKGEFIGATWSEVDWERALWSIPAAQMKAGKPHTVHLAEQAR